MEVLRGNQSGSKHSRRRSDYSGLGENRALNWSTLDSDIALQPHSPLALADILSSQGGFLDLVPTTIADTNATDTNDKSEPNLDSDQTLATSPDLYLSSTIDTTASRRQKRSPRERSNLLTRHSSAELLDQCKRILVENALVKNKGERQLYLAAGFISWPDANKPAERIRAPLLLYPALLVRVTDEQQYEIRLAGGMPEYNEALTIQADQLHEIKLPQLSENTPLSDYFAQVAQSINSESSLNLEFDVALGSATLFHQESVTSESIDLPDVPTHFDIGLAMSITGNKSLGQLNAVLQLIPDYTQEDLSSVTLATSIAPTSNVAGLRKYAARLAAEGLDHVEFGQLSALPSRIDNWTTSLSAALSGRTINSILNISELSARELIKLGGIIELIDKAPSNIDQFAHSDLCYSSSTPLLRRAQHQAKLIEDELSELQEYFLLDKVPAKSQLLSLMTELGGSIEQEPDFVDAEYFNARRQFMEFSTLKLANLTTEHKRLLSQLAKVLRFRELFVNNTEYRAALGPGYKGLRTDWQALSNNSDYARELSEVLESESIAAQILSNWHEFRAAFAIELESIQRAGEATRRLLGVVGIRWQSQTASSLVNHATLMASRILEWRTIYGPVENHAEKTPAMVLSSFSGKSRDDIVVETQVDETQQRLSRQLEAGEISREQITDTLKWLLAASSAATRSELDIDAIVEHLQIA